MTMAKKVKVTWIKSTAGALTRHRKTLRALGFTKLNSSVEHELTPAIAGMIDQVSYLVRIEELPE